jgi:hypothetical protein
LRGSKVVGTDESLDSVPVDDVNAMMVQMKEEMKDDVHQMKKLNKDTQHW